MRTSCGRETMSRETPMQLHPNDKIEVRVPAASDPNAEATGSGERYRLMALAAITGALVFVCVLLALPFLPAIAWGAALAIIVWPMHRWIRTRITNATAA